jgi:transcriptional regulator with XRE-family HTH domain
MSEQPVTPADVPEWDVADRLRKALRNAGIGTAEMAAYLGVSRQSVGNWINGRIAPSTQTLRLWALRTGVPYSWLSGSKSALILILATRAFPYALAA